jgi:hypothetical protein
VLFNSRFKCKGALSKAIETVEQFFALFSTEDFDVLKANC